MLVLARRTSLPLLGLAYIANGFAKRSHGFKGLGHVKYIFTQDFTLSMFPPSQQRFLSDLVYLGLMSLVHKDIYCFLCVWEVFCCTVIK